MHRTPMCLLVVVGLLSSGCRDEHHPQTAVYCYTDDNCPSLAYARNNGVCELGGSECDAHADCAAPPPCHSATAATCKAGVCQYLLAIAGTACRPDNGCLGMGTCDSSGRCVATTASCEDPPEPTCFGDRLRVSAPVGRCEGGGCKYDETEIGCPHCPACLSGCLIDINGDGQLEQVGAGELQASNTCFFCDPEASRIRWTSVSCDDGNPCTDDSCDAARGCTHTPNTLPCSDGNGCTEGDICDAGKCRAGTSVNCDDGEVCTDDSCDPANGCVHAPNSLACDDGSACTTGDTCSGGKCQAGAQLDCDDHEVCTNDSCDPTQGCVHAANTASCDDSNACTINDYCGGGECQGGPSLDCDDHQSCTDDTCNPTSGCVHTPRQAACDDGNACTDDSCDPTSGCVHTPRQAGCDDGNACTVNDQCVAGACSPGTSANCDDLDPCTDDGCEPVAGCIHKRNPLLCPVPIAVSLFPASGNRIRQDGADELIDIVFAQKMTSACEPVTAVDSYDENPFSASISEGAAVLKVVIEDCPTGSLEGAKTRVSWKIPDAGLGDATTWGGLAGEVKIAVPRAVGAYEVRLLVEVDGGKPVEISRKLLVTLAPPLSQVDPPRLSWYEKGVEWAKGAAAADEALSRIHHGAFNHGREGNWRFGYDFGSIHSCSWEDLVARGSGCNYGDGRSFSAVLENIAATLGVGGVNAHLIQGRSGLGFISRRVSSFDGKFPGNAVLRGSASYDRYMLATHTVSAWNGQFYDVVFGMVYASESALVQVSVYEECFDQYAARCTTYYGTAIYRNPGSVYDGWGDYVYPSAIETETDD